MLEIFSRQNWIPLPPLNPFQTQCWRGLAEKDPEKRDTNGTFFFALVYNPG